MELEAIFTMSRDLEEEEGPRGTCYQHPGTSIELLEDLKVDNGRRTTRNLQ